MPSHVTYIKRNDWISHILYYFLNSWCWMMLQVLCIGRRRKIEYAAQALGKHDSNLPNRAEEAHGEPGVKSNKIMGMKTIL